MYHLSIFSAWHQNFYYYHVVVDWNIAFVLSRWQMATKSENIRVFADVKVLLQCHTLGMNRDLS